MLLPRALSGGAVALLAAALTLACGSSSQNSSSQVKHDAGGSGAGGSGGIDAGTGAAAGSDGGVDSDAGCPSGTQSCGGQCVATDDPTYGCGDGSCQPCALANAMATCTSGACAIDKCNAGYRDCNADPGDGCEVQPDTDLANCGSCGNQCVTPHATPVCSSGQCSIGACDAGFADCNSDPTDGCEANVDADPTTCGTCGNVCPATGGSPVCNSGQCGISVCPVGTDECDGDPTTVCEANLKLDPANCGFCGNVCALPNASSTCSMGVCLVTACNSGFDDCDGKPADGCETNLGSSVNNCGGCGKACTNPDGQTTCVSSVCVPSCSAGFGDCDGDPRNGCETSTDTDPLNCGSCGSACSSTHGTASCASGKCAIACSAGWGNCDGNAQSNGCETPLDTVSNCGACGAVCSRANATTSCGTGTCQITSCNAGWGNCDGKADTGCETNIQTSTNDCGACGTVCSNANGTPSCSGGVCAIVCGAGWGNCDGNAQSNGCETSLDSNTNCGACGLSCSLLNATTSCSTGSCQFVSCNAGWSDCDGVSSNGCETNTQTDVNNCGVCGTICSNVNGTPSCSLGNCSITCNVGWGNCDGIALNGCEANLLSDNAHCGSCAIACGANQTCINGSCKTTAAVCGNGVIESGEQCDDGNTRNLDGCSSTCKYEQIQRVTQLFVRTTSPSPSYCSPTTNQFGKALTNVVVKSFNSSLQTDIDNGVLNTMLDFLGLDDLTGVSDPSLTVGMVNGTLDPRKGTWTPPGAIDWWFLANASDIDASGIPLYQFSPAAIASQVLTGGPSTVVLDYNGSPLEMLGAHLKAQIGATTSVPAPPPSALASGLTAFETMNANNAGFGLCGNITVGSLAAIPAPQQLTVGGTDACRASCSSSLSYTYCGAGNPVGPTCNSLLDVLVGGCKTSFLCITITRPTQPDVGVGGNPPNTLTNGNNNKVSVSQPNDAYSSYFQFTAQRAHITNNLP